MHNAILYTVTFHCSALFRKCDVEEYKSIVLIQKVKKLNLFISMRRCSWEGYIFYKCKKTKQKTKNLNTMVLKVTIKISVLITY